MNLDAVYLVAPKAKSQIAGDFYYSNTSSQTPPQIPLNGPVHVEYRVLRNVVTSATAILFVKEPIKTRGANHGVRISLVNRKIN